MSESLLSIRNLSVRYSGGMGTERGVHKVHLDVFSGDRFGVVGESGGGKSTLALAVLGLLPSPHAQVLSGSIFFEGRDLLRLSEQSMRALRGRSIALLPQNANQAFNPVQTMESQIVGIVRRQRNLGISAVRRQLLDMTKSLGFGDAARILRRFPHELSGGMRQRFMIALALLCRPCLLIADEPTSALDPTIRDLVLRHLIDRCDSAGTSLMLITHDFGVVAGYCDRVAVMHRGEVVEQAGVRELFRAAKHPHTRSLLAAIPDWRL